MSQQLLTALVFGIFALAFLVVWYNHRHLRSSGIWALSYLSASIGFFFEYVMDEFKSLRFLTPIGDTFYLIGPLLLTVGIAIRYGEKIPDLALALIFMSTFMQAYWFWFVNENSVLRTEIVTYACAGMVAIAAYIIYRCMKSLLDRVLLFVVLAFAGQFVLTTIFSVHLNPENSAGQNFLNSSYIELLHLSVAVTAVSVAFLLFAGLVIEIRQSSKNSLLTGNAPDVGKSALV